MKRVMLTGAGGFIGSHVAEELVRSGYQVRAHVRYNSNGSRGWLETIDPELRDEMEIVLGDIRDSSSVSARMKGCDAVLHLAALIGIPYSYEAAASYVETNVGGTLNLLLSAREQGVERFVQTSTSEVYGTAITAPITESHPLQGQSPYSATKIGADQLALSFFRSFNVPVTVIRPFNTYGPRQSLRAVIPTIINQVLFGDGTVRLGSLHPTRDLTFVHDTARAFVATLEGTNISGETMNIGTGFEISVRDLVSLIARLVGREVTTEEDSTRVRPPKSEVERLIADASRARTLLGWQPKYSGIGGLENGISRTIEWMKNNSFQEHSWNRYQV